MYLTKLYDVDFKSERSLSKLESLLNKLVLVNGTSSKKSSSQLESAKDSIMNLTPKYNESFGKGDELPESKNNSYEISDTFEVLYNTNESISLFGKDINKKLILCGNEEQIKEFDEYLAEHTNKLNEVRLVENATYKFHTHVRSDSTIKGGKKMYDELFSSSPFSLNVVINIDDGELAGSNGDALQGYVSGNLRDVLKARDIIRNPGSDLPLYNDGLVFH